VSPIRRALVLGSGGASGVAWQLGVLCGLADAGVDLGRADLVVGTSAGALTAAWLAAGSLDAFAEGFAPLTRTPVEPPARLRPTAVARLLAAQVSPSRRHALAWLGRRAAAAWSADAQDEWVSLVAPGLSGLPWPPSLVIVATDVASGRPAYFSAQRPVDLAGAVAASCAVPGVLPAVRIEGRLFFDGGLRSPANLDVASGAGSVVALAPFSGSVRAVRRPRVQAAALAASGTRTVLLEPSRSSRLALGRDFLSPRSSHRAAADGAAQAARQASRVWDVWDGPGPRPRSGDRG